MNDNINGAAPAAPTAAAAPAATVPFYQSQVVIGAIISGISMLLALFGLPALGVTDQDVLTKSLVAIGGGVGALVSVIGRIRTLGARPLSLGSVKGSGTAAALMLAISATSLSGCATVDLNKRLGQAEAVVTTGDVLVAGAQLGGLISADTASRIRDGLARARQAIALARSALSIGDSTSATAQADAALQAAREATELLHQLAPTAPDTVELRGQAAVLTADAEQLAADARR